MNPDDLRPVPGDPSAAVVESMFDMRDAEWLMTAGGDYRAAAAEVMLADGSNFDRAVILEWPARVNHSTEMRTVRLVMAAEDAIGLADVLAHAGGWLLGLPR